MITGPGQHARSPRNLSQFTVKVVDICGLKTLTLEHLRSVSTQYDRACWPQVAYYPAFEKGNRCAVANQEMVENTATSASEEFWLADVQHCHKKWQALSTVPTRDEKAMLGTLNNQHAPRRGRVVVSKDLKVAPAEVRFDKRRIGHNRHGPPRWPRRVDNQYRVGIQELKTQSQVKFDHIATRRQVRKGVIRLLQNGSQQPDGVTSIGVEDAKGTQIADTLNNAVDLPLGVERDVRPDDAVVVDQHVAVIRRVGCPLRVDSRGPRPGRDSLIQVPVQELRDKLDVVVLDRTKRNRRMGHVCRSGCFIFIALRSGAESGSLVSWPSTSVERALDSGTEQNVISNSSNPKARVR